MNNSNRRSESQDIGSTGHHGKISSLPETINAGGLPMPVSITSIVERRRNTSQQSSTVVKSGEGKVYNLNLNPDKNS